jgi:coenzyme F420-0:L-glutamate ligase/coenzyme F420-1:gamma-L-glutamate ligase
VPEEELPAFTTFALAPIPEVTEGDDLDALIAEAIERSGLGLRNGDILVVTQKVVSKAEGRLVDLRKVVPSTLASDFARRYDKDPRQVEVVLQESARIVRMDRGVIISETRHGFVCANAGVDASNVGLQMVCLLPLDPDASALRLMRSLEHRFGVSPAVIISDSFGRPWRNGIVNVAIGVAGLAPLADYRGLTDNSGYELHVTVMAVADELAAAAELVANKLDRRPIVLIRGYRPPVEAPAGTARDLILDSQRDLFR